MKTSFIKWTIGITLFLFFGHFALAQNLTQVVRGKVIDKTTQTVLTNASVTINTAPETATATDQNGTFKFDEIPIGRYSIEVKLEGYSPTIVPEILIGSGKEMIVTVEMSELAYQIEEVVIIPENNKGKPLNDMASVSARSFKVEETSCYAGGLDDPARLVTAYAGVTSGGSMQDNAIVIRGNAPKNVLWRVEGVDVVNPSHFSGANVAGGGFTSVISSQVLANSDFYTGAFPAEYGNALGGVFDIHLRTGNNEKSEKAIQLGVLGLDLSAEGPFKKGGKASYLFNYRYSTFGILNKLKILDTDQTPIYQDLSFKLVFPTEKAGTFSFWGLGGNDKLYKDEIDDPGEWENNYDRLKNTWDETFGAIGLNNRYAFNSKTYLNTSVVATGTFKDLHQERLDDNLVLQKDVDLNSNLGKISLNTLLNHKFNNHFNIRTGFNFNNLIYKYDLSGTQNDNPDSYADYVKDSGSSMHTQVYVEGKYSINNKLSFFAGLQTEYFALNNDFTLDPRLSMSWKFRPKHTFTLGYGKHSQLEDLNIYFIKDSNSTGVEYPNKNLNFSHAHHFVMGYEYQLNRGLRLKVEPYYQYLYDIPGIANSSFSMINFKQDITFQSALENNSVGKNIGIDFTWEQFLKNNYYYLITSSVFDSKYKADDGIWRDTRYNKNFVLNFLGGKEFAIGRTKNNLLGVNLRGVIEGGERYTPLDEAASIQAGYPIYNEELAFSERDKTSMFVHLSLIYRINKAKHSSIWSLQMYNVLGAKQYDPNYEYNFEKQAFIRDEHIYRVPVLSYKIEF